MLMISSEPHQPLCEFRTVPVVQREDTVRAFLDTAAVECYETAGLGGTTWHAAFDATAADRGRPLNPVAYRMLAALGFRHTNAPEAFYGPVVLTQTPEPAAALGAMNQLELVLGDALC
jgi:hypothetical protein